MFLESLTDAERKEWVVGVITRVMRLHGVKNRQELDSIYNFPSGTTNTLVSNASLKRVFDLALTASQHFKISLDYLLLGFENKTEDLKPEIENGVFKACEAGLIKVDYRNIEPVADIILDEINPKHQPLVGIAS